MIFVSKVILLPLKGIILRVTFPKVSRYGIMAIISLLLWNSCSILFKCGIVASQIEPSSSVSFLPSRCLFCVSARDVPTSHSISWSWVARSMWRSLLVEFPLFLWSLCLYGDLESKDAKINLKQWLNTFEKEMDHEDCDSFVTTFFLLPHVLNLGTRFLFSGGELSHP